MRFVLLSLCDVLYTAFCCLIGSFHYLKYFTDEDRYVPIIVTTIKSFLVECDITNKNYHLRCSVHECHIYSRIWAFKSIWDHHPGFWWCLCWLVSRLLYCYYVYCFCFFCSFFWKWGSSWYWHEIENSIFIVWVSLLLWYLSPLYYMYFESTTNQHILSCLLYKTPFFLF